jgi:hypothetical protein
MVERNPTLPATRRPVYVDRYPRPSFWGSCSFWLGLLQIPLFALAIAIGSMPGGHPPAAAYVIIWLVPPIAVFSVLGLLLGLIALKRPQPTWRAKLGIGLNALAFLPIAVGIFGLITAR